MQSIILSDAQIETVVKHLSEHISYAPLKEELLDHLCCAIEDELNQGLVFEEAIQLVLNRFGEEGLLGVQKKTLDILNHNSKRMKQLIFLGSIAAAIYLIMMVSVFSQRLPTYIPMEGKVSSEFGPKTHKKNNTQKLHMGIDIKAEEGTPIYAAADGTVEFAENKGAYGLLVKLQHDGQYETWYAHLSKVAVKPGTSVKQGQLIAYCGNTGNSTGPHLHFEVRRDGHPINPREMWEQ